jgi:Spherulation-specific family 4/PEP-CTERM motif
MSYSRKIAAAILALGIHSSVWATALLVPAYFYPSSDPTQSYWDELTAAAASGADVTAIMNPANGPGSAFNADYATAVNSFRAAGGKVLGYVYTCYGGTQCFTGLPPTHTTTQVLAAAQRYADWYGVDGIFLDEMSNRLADLPYYQTVAQGLRAAHAGWRIVGNPGTSTPAAYLAVADTLVTLENGTGSYATASTEPWMLAADPARQANLFYNVATADAMRALLTEAVARNVGYVYFTDDRYIVGDPVADNPWDRLPSFWTAEVAAVRAVRSVPEPASAILLMVGMAALLVMRRRAGPIEKTA